MRTDIFVSVRLPDGTYRFFPDGEDYAVPFHSAVELKEPPASRTICVRGREEWFSTSGEYEFCAALFENGSNPNLLSNCYWSSIESYTNADLTFTT